MKGEMELPKGWEIRALGDIAKIITGKTPPTKRQELFGNKYPFITPTNIDNSLRFCDPDRFLSEEGANFQKSHLLPKNAICYTCIASIGKICMTKQDSFTNQQINSLIVNTNISHWFLFYALKYITPHIKNIAGRTAADIVNKTQFSNTKVLLPPLHEQKAIADTLSTWDEAIEKTERLIIAKQKRLHGLTQRLINNPNYRCGNVSDFASEISIRNKDNTISRVLSVTNHSGFVLPESQFQRRVASDSLLNYKVIHKGEYAYNPARINVGSIARLDDWDIGIVSPMYVAFKLDDKKINNDYFLHWLSSNETKQHIKNAEQGSVRKSVNFDGFGSIPIHLPNLSEQKNIADFLNTAKKEITLHKLILERYKTQKHGLTQKLLTGQWQVKSDIDNQNTE